jgi:hypothetical protein
MGEHAPEAIEQLAKQIIRAVPGAVLSGIVGDASHTYGYHRSRNWINASGQGGGDYSVQLGQDKKGDGDVAAALDVSLPPDTMKAVTHRLIKAMQDNDGRVRAVREVFGTVDGKHVTGWDRHNPDSTGDDSWTSSDDSHLWHVHLSFYRELATDAAALAPVAEVCGGHGKSQPGDDTHVDPAPAKPHGPHAAWPLPDGHYFGSISGPKESHGGFFIWERPYVQSIQRRLIKLGYVAGVQDVGSDWVDGTFGPATKDAVAAWQHDKWEAQTARFGEVWPDDWTRLHKAPAS